MKYFFITYTIRDGEYEYMRQTPVEAETLEEAEAKVKKENREWIKDDYRIATIDIVQEITADEYKIIKKYIY